MALYRGAVLADTNAIVESHRTGTWRALTARYDVETTEACITETQTGLLHRQPGRLINETELRNELAVVHAVDDEQHARLAKKISGIHLDLGEASLWVHILDRTDDNWSLSGPDIASLRCGIRLGFREKLVSLEKLLKDIGHPSAGKLRSQYKEQWHKQKLNDLVMTENETF